MDVNWRPLTCPAWKAVINNFEVHARRIWASVSASGGVNVSYNFMEPNGACEMHACENQNRLFYVLDGEMRVSNGTSEQLVPRGSALVVKAGKPHQVTGTGKMPCEYLLVTSSVAVTRIGESTRSVHRRGG